MKPKSSATGWLALLLPLLIVGYLGAYYAMIKPITYRRSMFSQHDHPTYRYSGKAAHLLFEPAYRLDLLIRPKYWSSDDVPLQIRNERSSTQQSGISWQAVKPLLLVGILTRSGANDITDHLMRWPGGGFLPYGSRQLRARRDQSYRSAAVRSCC